MSTVRRVDCDTADAATERLGEETGDESAAGLIACNGCTPVKTAGDRPGCGKGCVPAQPGRGPWKPGGTLGPGFGPPMKTGRIPQAGGSGANACRPVAVVCHCRSGRMVMPEDMLHMSSSLRCCCGGALALRLDRLPTTAGAAEGAVASCPAGLAASAAGFGRPFGGLLPDSLPTSLTAFGCFNRFGLDLAHLAHSPAAGGGGSVGVGSVSDGASTGGAIGGSACMSLGAGAGRTSRRFERSGALI